MHARRCIAGASGSATAPEGKGGLGTVVVVVAAVADVGQLLLDLCLHLNEACRDGPQPLLGLAHQLLGVMDGCTPQCTAAR
jgi:hypothetical protein